MNKRNSARNNIKIIYFVLLAALAVVALFAVENLLLPQEERVPEDDAVLGGAYEVVDYAMNVDVLKDHSYDVEHKLTVAIPKQLQIIRVTIPSGNYRIYDVDVEDTAAYADITSDSSRIVIVDPLKLSEGTKTFTIHYTVKEFEDRDASQDLFYFDALPPEWKQPIGNLEINVKFPDDFPWDDIQCYAGQFGVQDVNNKVTFKAKKSDKTVSLKGEKIPENYGVTLKSDLPNGYWTGALNGSWVLTAITAITAAMLIALIALWFVGGRDPKVEKSVENKPIENIPPSEIGYVFNSEVGIRDIILLLFEFGRKGYLAISEYEPKRYRIYRKEEPVGEERMYRNAYNILFEDVYKDRAVEMEDLGERLARILESIRDNIAAGYATSDREAFTPLSRIFRYVSGGLLALIVAVANALSYRYEYLQVNIAESLILAVITAASMYMLCAAVDKRESQTDERNILMELFGAILVVGCIAYASTGIFRRTGMTPLALGFMAACLVSIFFVIIMRARGKENAELVTRLRQLREFIYHPTPKDLLENHMADKNYYYDMLQYALAIGAEEAWAISFLTLDVPQPDWYSHEVEGHTLSNIREDESTVDYARDLKTFMRTIENAFAEFMRQRRKK